MAVTVRNARTGDAEAIAGAWRDAGRYYAELAPWRFQIPHPDGLATCGGSLNKSFEKPLLPDEL